MQQEKNNTKSFTSNSLYIFAAKFFPALAFTIVGIFASKQLATAHYGQFQNFWIQLFTLSAIATIGFPIFILTYSPTQVFSILRKIVAKHLALYVIFLLIISVLFGGLQNNNLLGSWIISSATILSFILIVLADALLLAFRVYKPLIGINLAFSAIFCFIHIRYIELSYDKTLVFIFLLCLSRLLAASTFIYSAFNTHKKSTVLASEINWQNVQTLWFHLGLNDIITVLFRWIDKFILSFLLIKETFAIYVNATNEIGFLPIIFSAVSSAAVQHWAMYHSISEAKDKIPILHYSTRILSSIIFPLFFFLIFYRIEFLSIVFGEQYVSGVSIFICAQLILPLRAYPFTAILQSQHRGDIINKGALIDFIMACVLMYPLYLLMGLPGVAISFVISSYWQAGYYLIQSSKITNKPIIELLPINILLKKFSLFALIFGLAFIISNQYLVTISHKFIFGIIVLGISSIVTLILEWHIAQKKNNL